MTYEEKAPTISGTGFSETAINSAFDGIPALPSPAPMPIVTQAHVQDILDRFTSKTSNPLAPEGINKIAQQEGLHPTQVADIVKELTILLTDYNAS